MLLYGLRIGACALVYASGFYLYGIAISDCIKSSLNAINQNAKLKAKRSHLSKQFIEFVVLHSDAQQLSAMEME